MPSILSPKRHDPSTAGRALSLRERMEVADRAVRLQPRYADKLMAAERTLLFLGYTYNGGHYWKPPLGPLPTTQR